MGQQLYSNTSGIEPLFFRMYKYHAATTWKGAYHLSPDYTHWYGWAEVNHDLELIKAEDRQLRALDALEAEPEDAGGTDPLVLALAALALVLAAIALAWNLMGKRRTQEPKQ